jgi:O-acetyl-ADP-ribose deacetylase (regulator of RNase III)
MIKHITKDITTVTSGIICSQVNCMGVMGSGVALAIKNKWPKVYDRYVKLHEIYKEQQWRLLGSFQKIRLDDNLFIINLFGQYDFGYDGQRRTEYGSLAESLNKLSTELYQMLRENDDIYIPYKMGCDRGGGDWNIVYDMIKTLLDNDNRTIYICRL